MDPVLDEMRRVKNAGDIRDSRFRDWVDYLCALVAAKDDEIARLKAQIAAPAAEWTVTDADLVAVPVKRGPGRPRKESASV